MPARRGQRGDRAPLEPAQLLGQRAVDGEIAGMKPRHIERGVVCLCKLRLDLIERHWCGIDDARTGRAVNEKLARHQRAGIEADRTAREQAATAHRDDRRRRSGADECRHGSRIARARRLRPDRNLRR
jgi:hypothetical protein